MQIDKERARLILLEEADLAESVPAPEEWEDRVEALSRACESSSKTHIAFLGTALLAKATHLETDAFAVKQGSDSPGSYSARSLAKDVLVPVCAKRRIDLGVTGREPLNNQPYFRIKRADPNVILPLVRDKAPVILLLDILEEVNRVGTAEDARAALRAFIKVRRRHSPEYPTAAMQAGQFNLYELAETMSRFVAADSEGGKRAQAVAAGILAAVFDSDRIVAGRINDPDRHLAGDVGVSDEADSWSLVIEVRDKPVTEDDLVLFARKTAQAGVSHAAVLAVASGQPEIETTGPVAWADEAGVCLRVYSSWSELIRDAVFWRGVSPLEFVERAVAAIRDRLVEVETSVEGVARWVRETAPEYGEDE